MFTHVNLSPNTSVQQQWRWRVETRVAMRAFNQHNGVMRVLETRMGAATLMRHRSLREGPIPIPVFRPTSSCDTLRFTVKYDARTMYNIYIYTCFYLSAYFSIGTRFLAPSILNYPRSCIIDSRSMYPVHFNRIFLKEVSKISKNSVALVKNVTKICPQIFTKDYVLLDCISVLIKLS